MFSIHARSMYSIPSFDEAKRHYERTPHPRARSRGDLIFEENERPLDGARQHHKRLVLNKDGSFGVVLYETEMIRYYPPAEDGSKRVKLYHHGSVSSSAFMWRHGWSLGNGAKFDTYEGPVWVPLLCNARHPHEYWSADLVFDARDRLIVEKSWHVQMAKILTSPERKRARREVVKRFAHLVKFAAQTVSEAWRPGAIEPKDAIRGVFYDDSKAAESDVLQWPIACSQGPTALNNRLCHALSLYLGDTQEVLPLFMPAADAPNWRAARNLRPAG